MVPAEIAFICQITQSKPVGIPNPRCKMLITLQDTVISYQFTGASFEQPYLMLITSLFIYITGSFNNRLLCQLTQVWFSREPTQWFQVDNIFWLKGEYGTFAVPTSYTLSGFEYSIGICGMPYYLMVHNCVHHDHCNWDMIKIIGLTKNNHTIKSIRETNSESLWGWEPNPKYA